VCQPKREPAGHETTNPFRAFWLTVEQMSGSDTDTLPTGERLSILVGAPDPRLREKLVSELRRMGHQVLEAGDAQGMRARLAESTDLTGEPLDVILCGGLFAEKEDAELAQRLASPGVTRALILIPAGGMLSTATRAQRLGAAAVMAELPNAKDLWELFGRAAGTGGA